MSPTSSLRLRASLARNWASSRLLNGDFAIGLGVSAASGPCMPSGRCALALGPDGISGLRTGPLGSRRRPTLAGAAEDIVDFARVFLGGLGATTVIPLRSPSWASSPLSLALMGV